MLILLALTLAPVAAVLIFVYHHDRHEREPAVHMAACFALGIVASAVAVALELGAQRLGFDGTTSVTMTFGFAFVVVGLSEEGSKFVALRIYAYRQREFNEPYDGIIYAVLVSMGFASVENLLYVLGPGNVGDGTRIALLRMFTAPSAPSALTGTAHHSRRPPTPTDRFVRRQHRRHLGRPGVRTATVID